jgi:hypothetical protein
MQYRSEEWLKNFDKQVKNFRSAAEPLRLGRQPMDVLFCGLGLLIKDIKPSIAAFLVKRADPNRAWHCLTVACRLLSGVVGQEGGICIQHRHVELVDGITLDLAGGSRDGRQHLVFVGEPVESDLNMIVGKKVLKELRIPVFPSLPRLPLEINQALSPCTILSLGAG